MKKYLALSSVVIGLLSLSSLNAADNLESMFSEGKASGQIRMFYIDREYEGSSGASTHRDSTAIGGHLKYETATLKGINLGASFYTTQKVDLNQHGVEDPSLLGTDLDSYSILGEAYVGLDFLEYGTKTTGKLGLQRYDTPMMGSDDARMLPNTFEAYTLVNKDIDGLSVQVAHVTKIAYGTFSNIYNNSGILGATSGYSGQGKNIAGTVTGNNPETGEYYNLGEAVSGENSSGITNVMLTYKNDNFNAKLSNDYAWDLYNTLYMDASVNWTCLFSDEVKPFFAVQMIKQNSVGDENMKYADDDLAGMTNHDGEIDSLFWAAKFGAKVSGFSAYVAYSETTDNDDGDANYKNAIISQFGGMPAYTQGIVTRHQFLAGTKATKVAASYSFKEHGLNLSASTFYSSFDMDKNSGYGVQRTAYEPGFDIQYFPDAVKNLQLRFRGDFPRKYKEATTTSGDTGWNEYRLIANYNF